MTTKTTLKKLLKINNNNKMETTYPIHSHFRLLVLSPPYSPHPHPITKSFSCEITLLLPPQPVFSIHYPDYVDGLSLKKRTIVFIAWMASHRLGTA